MRNTLFLITIFILLFPGPGLTLAQDDDWTCNDGPNDVLNAAQAAYDAGELEQAYELALQAEAVCGTGTTMNTARFIQATQLKGKIEQEMLPTPTPSPLVEGQRLYDLGMEALSQGHYEEGVTYLEQALAILLEFFGICLGHSSSPQFSVTLPLFSLH